MIANNIKNRILNYLNVKIKNIKQIYNTNGRYIFSKMLQAILLVPGLPNTGEVTSKVAVIVSINRQFWFIYVGLPTKYGISTYVNKPGLPTYIQDHRDFRGDLACIMVCFHLCCI